ncbi:MAG: 4Fe-4S binding protein [Deltaproteobacteria bacterium]|nr:4Fe-4S binding protein [Candidatus Zymogenaceae bacterium]
MGRSKRMYDFIMGFYRLFQRLDDCGLIPHNDSEENTSGHIIPVEEVIVGGRHVVLPMEVLVPLIERADTVAIMNECFCRRGDRCRAFPQELGCLLLGEAARDLAQGLGRIVTKDEAVAHGARAIDMGLLPLVVHNKFDAWIWGLEYRRMMNICFCCECCCSVRLGIKKEISTGFFQNIHRLSGLRIEVGEECLGCGVCRDVCIAGAITIREGRALVDHDRCKGCGRCVAVCKAGAARLVLDDERRAIDEILRVYNDRTDVGDLTES